MGNFPTFHGIWNAEVYAIDSGQVESTLSRLFNSLSSIRVCNTCNEYDRMTSLFRNRFQKEEIEPEHIAWSGFRILPENFNRQSMLAR